jgi:hypothetical protein
MIRMSVKLILMVSQGFRLSTSLPSVSTAWSASCIEIPKEEQSES